MTSITERLVSTEDWIQEHGLRSRKLSRDQLLKKLGFRAASGYVGAIKKNVRSRYSADMYNVIKDGHGNNIYLTGRADDLQKEEVNLRSLITALQERIEWLGSGSRERFGVVTEKRVLLLMDSYEYSNVTFGEFCSAVAGLVREQVVEVEAFNITRVGDEVNECWKTLTEITKNSLRQGLAFILSQQPTVVIQKNALLQLLGSMINLENVDSIYLLVQGSPDSTTYSELSKMTKECKIPINTCQYGETDEVFSNLLTDMSANTGGRWHKFTEKGSHSKDTEKLTEELNFARDVLAEITALRMELQLKNKPQAPVPSHKIPSRSEKDLTSTEWLKLHGLKSTGSRFYDALAGQAFRHCDKIVKVGDSDKVVNAKYCEKFAHVKWWDGTVKHVIVNQNFYDKYKDKVQGVIDLIEKRISWVEQSSKMMFGTLLEDTVCILLDTSESMQPHLGNLKKRLEKLITEQLRDKEKFTIATFGSEVRWFSKELVRVCPQSLQEAWKWCNELQCSGSTNTLDALKFALCLPDLQGVYLLTDGSPDVPEEQILNQIKLYKDLPIHTISFNCGDRKANEFLATLAQETSSRFHVVRSDDAVEYEGPDPYESTDIKLLKLEVDSAHLDLKKMAELRGECEILEWKCVKKPPSKSGEKPRKRRIVKKPAELSDTESVMSGRGVFSAKRWLAKYGLVAQKLTVMDALAPTVITQQPKYVGVLKKKVHAKVFDGVMPFTFLTPEDKDSVSFVNPAGVDLAAYESKVKGAVALYDKKIAHVIWKKLHDKEKEKFSGFDENQVPGFKECEDLFRRILEKNGWVVSQKTVNLMSNEIDLGTLYITQSHQLRDNVTKPANCNQKPGSSPTKSEKKPSRSDSYLLGYRVVAQNNVDGFYYPGTVIGTKDKVRCEIEFDDFDRQTVYVNNLIPTQGSTARPKVKAGDYVLVQLILNRPAEDSKQKLLAPGLIVKSPDHPTDISFIILLFTGEKLIASRHDLIKITNNRYKATAQSIFKHLSRQRSSQKLRLVAEGAQEDTSSVASTLDEILKSNLLLNKPRSLPGDQGVKLEDLISTPRVSEVPEEEEEEDKSRDDHVVSTCDVGVETPREMAKVTLECGLQVGGYDADVQTQIGTDFWEALDKVRYSPQEIIHPSEIIVDNTPIPVVPHISIPVLKVSASTEQQTDEVLSVPDLETFRSVLREGEQSVTMERGDDDVTVVTAKLVDSDDGSTLSSSSSKHSKGFFDSSDSSSSSDSKIQKSQKPSKARAGEGVVVRYNKGHVVLARWSDEGWYFRGKVVRRTEAGYLVEDNSGNQEDILAKHVLSDEQDGKKVLKAGYHVIALHPDYSFSYAPAKVLGTEDNWFFSVKFYDQTEGDVPREEMYFIPTDQYYDDVKFIRDIEETLLGSLVVARDNADGLYRRGMVIKSTGRSYEISLNGESNLQDPSQVFTDNKKVGNKNLKEGSLCLAPLDNLQNTFAPAKILAVNEDESLKVVFYDESELYYVERSAVYPINLDFYVNAVNYIKSR